MSPTVPHPYKKVIFQSSIGTLSPIWKPNNIPLPDDGNSGIVPSAPALFPEGVEKRGGGVRKSRVEEPRLAGGGIGHSVRRMRGSGAAAAHVLNQAVSEYNSALAKDITKWLLTNFKTLQNC
jgi:hypothetical protein